MWQRLWRWLCPRPTVDLVVRGGHCCPACLGRLPLVGVMPNQQILREDWPMELTYDCPRCGAALHEKGARVTAA